MEHQRINPRRTLNWKASNNIIIPTLVLASSMAFNTSDETVPSESNLDVSVSKVTYNDFSIIKDSWVKNILTKLRENATINGFDLPNKKVFKLTSELIHAFQRKNHLPQFINPSTEGGVIMEYLSGKRFVVIEIVNEGEIALLRGNTDDNGTEAFDLNEKNLLQYALESL